MGGKKETVKKSRRNREITHFFFFFFLQIPFFQIPLYVLEYKQRRVYAQPLPIAQPRSRFQ